MSGTATSNTVVLTVHGAGGIVDLVVPVDAQVDDVAREYAAQAGLAQPPLLLTATGQRLHPQGTLVRQRVESGAVLVATNQLLPPRTSTELPGHESAPDGSTSPSAWFAVAAVLGAGAGVLGALAAGDAQRSTMALLVGAFAIGIAPVGAHADRRAMFAPAFLGAAGFAAAYEPGATQLPLVVGISGLTAAVGAGLARALTTGRTEPFTAWIVAGLGTFGVAGVCVLAGAAPQVTWALLLVAVLLAARVVPGMAIDVPDQLLIDLERLAVNAWSARDRTGGKRGRTVVPQGAVQDLLAHGSLLVNASGVAILVVTVVSAPALLSTATVHPDRIGALALVFFCGAGLLLAARSYRHPVARTGLRVAGLYAWACLAISVLTHADEGTLMRTSILAVVAAGGVVPAAIATGRGWRSVWWARRAEIGEVLCVALAVASVVVAVGVFRALWA